MARKRKGLQGSSSEHANEAERWFRSASNNFRRRESDPPRMSCSSIGHMTDVIAEATVATVAAHHAGNRSLEFEADQLITRASLKQREFIAACRLRERALAVTGQEGNRRPPPRRRG